MTIIVAPSSTVARHSSSASSERLVSVTTVPPARSGIIEPSHIPVPCMSGQPGMLTGAWPLSCSDFTISGICAASVGTGKPVAA